MGPVASPQHCINTPYSSTRVLAPFDSTATSVDWRSWDVVESMQNQGICGSCYAFSTIAAAESAYAIHTGKLYKLSEQHIVSCDTRNLGCNGGLQWWASEFLKDNGVILSSDYPYVNANTGSTEACNANREKNKVFYLTGSRGY